MSHDTVVLSLCDYSAKMVQPWAEDGYRCIVVDTKHQGEERVEDHGEGTIEYVGADIRDYRPPNVEYEIVFGFPPCTNLAVSGARWFTDKGLAGLADGIRLVEECRDIAEWCDAPWMIENPVSTLSTYWRDPDHIFHPYEYDNYTDEDDAYSKKTCLWTGNGFLMPQTDGVDEYDDRIHKMAPSEDRSEKRSQTPMGFARAVYESHSLPDMSCVEVPADD